MLALPNITLRRGQRVLVEHASFQFRARQRLGVIGASGCSKSSLSAMILGELETDDGELVLNPGRKHLTSSRRTRTGTGRPSTTSWTATAAAQPRPRSCILQASAIVEIECDDSAYRVIWAS